MAATITRNINLDVDPAIDFEPGMFSIPELHFIGDHLKDEPIVAFHDFDPDGKHKGVMRARVEPFLALVSELQLLEDKRGVPWAGYGPIRDSIERFILWHERSLEIKRRSQGAFANPSMWFWDDMGKAHKYAIDADSGEMVRTEIQDDGSRVAFRVRLTLKPEDALRESVRDLMPWTTAKSGEVRKDKLETNTSGRLGYHRCPVCQHTEEFRSASSQQKAAAWSRMARHLRVAKDEVNRHRLLYTKTFK